MCLLAGSVTVLAGGDTPVVRVSTVYTVDVEKTTLVENFVADLVRVTVSTTEHTTLLSMVEAFPRYRSRGKKRTSCRKDGRSILSG